MNNTWHDGMTVFFCFGGSNNANIWQIEGLPSNNECILWVGDTRTSVWPLRSKFGH